MLFTEKQSFFTRIKQQLCCVARVPFDKFLRTVGFKSLPEVIIIGAQKSGTSALFNYMNQHPCLQGPYKKEVHYFDAQYYQNGISWYSKQFSPVSKNKIIFEATPSYLYRNWCAERIYKYNKDIKLIAVLREPVGRAFSAWNMARQVYFSDERDRIVESTIGIQNKKIKEGMTELLTAEHFKSFSECIFRELDIIKSGEENPVPNFIRRGIYAEQINRYFKFFEKEQLLILDHKDLIEQPDKVLGKIESFVGVRNIDWSDKDLGKKHVGAYSTGIDNDTELLLKDFYKSHNEKLFNLIGKEFDW